MLWLAYLLSWEQVDLLMGIRDWSLREGLLQRILRVSLEGTSMIMSYAMAAKVPIQFFQRKIVCSSSAVSRWMIKESLMWMICSQSIGEAVDSWVFLHVISLKSLILEA